MEHTRRARARSVAPNGWLGQSAFGIAERLGEGGKEKRTQRIATGVMVMGILLPLLVASVGVTAWAVANDVGSRERNRGSFPAEMTEFFGGRRTSPQKRSDIFNFDDPSSSFSSFFDLDENPFTNDDAEDFRRESSIPSRTSTYPSKHPPPPNPRSSSSTVNDRSHSFGPTSFSSSSPSFSRHPSSHSNSYKNAESSSQQYGKRGFSQFNSANFQDQQEMHSNSDKTESNGNYKNTSASSPNQIVVGPFHVTVVDSKSPLLASLGLNQLQKTPEKSSSSPTSKQSNHPLSSNSPPSLISAASTRSSPSYTEYPRYREHHNAKQHISPNNFEYGRYKDFKHNDEQGRYQEDDFSSSEEDSSQLSQEEPRNPYDSPEHLQRLPPPKPYPHSSGPPPFSGEPYNTRNYGSIIDLSANARNPSKPPNTRPPHGEENPHHSHNGPSNTWQPHPQHQNNPPPYNRETQHSGPLYPYHPPPIPSKPPSYPPPNERPETQPQSSPPPPNKASPPSSHYPPSHYSKPGTYPSQESRYSTSSSGHPPPPHYHPPHHSTSSSTSSSSYGGSPTTKTSSRTGSVSYGSHHHGHYHPSPSKPKITLSFKARPPSGSSHFHTSIGHGGGGGLSIPLSVNPIEVMKKLVNPLAILNPLANKKVTIGITIEQKNDHPPLSVSHGGY